MAKQKMNKLFLTINAGEKPEEAKPIVFPKYIGIAPVQILALNPTKQELEALYGREVQNEPEYRIQTGDFSGYRLEFHVKTHPNALNGTEVYGRLKFLLSEREIGAKDGSSFQVIDDYGESTWVTKEQFETQQRPDTCRVVGNYHKCHAGEAELLHFLKEWLNMNLSTSWNQESHRWIPASPEELEKCKILVNWSELCKGNISELRELVQKYKDYYVKVCFGIKTADNNRHYQEICNRVFLRNNSNRYSTFNKEINRLKQNGLYPDIEFSADFLREWKPQTAVFTNTISDQPAATSNMFGQPVAQEVLTVPDPNDQTFTNDLPF